MIIEKGQRILVLRVGEYKKHSFIKEHISVIQEHGCTWMMKLGKAISDGSLESTIGKNGVVILREPKNVGGKLYLCKCKEFRNGNPQSDYVFPKYYEEMFSEYYWQETSGTWLCLTSINPLKYEYYDKLLLVQNDKPLMQVLGETRTSMLYVKNTMDFQV